MQVLRRPGWWRQEYSSLPSFLSLYPGSLGRPLNLEGSSWEECLAAKKEAQFLSQSLRSGSRHFGRQGTIRIVRERNERGNRGSFSEERIVPGTGTSMTKSTFPRRSVIGVELSEPTILGDRPESVRVSDAGPVRAVDTLRGRRPKASDERTRGKASGVGGLWGFGRTAALAEDGFAQIAESGRPPKMADWAVPRCSAG